MTHPTPLLIVHNRSTVYAIPLTGGTQWTIGRSQANEIVLYDRWVSRHHARLEVRNQVEIYLRDLDSRNGTWVNGKRLSEFIPLHHETQFRIGEHLLEFRLGGVTFEGTCPPGASQRVVMIAAASGWQEQIWRELLISQGILVLTEKPEQVLPLLVEMNPLLPELLLLLGNEVDVDSFARQYHQQFPRLPIVLASSTLSSITSEDRAWAKAQGLLDVLPRLPEDEFVAKAGGLGRSLTKILQYLDWRPLQESYLDSALLNLQAQVEDDEPSQILGDFV